MAGAAGLTINSFVFIDLETSHLYPTDRPTITEMSLIAINRKGLLNPGVLTSLNCAIRDDATYNLSKVSLPRIIDKLTLCLDPRKCTSPQSSRITKLDKLNLDENKKLPFNEDVTSMLNIFLGRQESPMCLVAHNGNKFDYPILRSELSRLTTEDPFQDMYCVDSLSGFRAGFPTGQESSCMHPEPDFSLKRKLPKRDNSTGTQFPQKRCLGPFDQHAQGGGGTLPESVIPAEVKISSCNDQSPGVSDTAVQGLASTITRSRSFDAIDIHQLALLPQLIKLPSYIDRPDETTPKSPYVHFALANATPQRNFSSHSFPPPLRKAQSEPYYRKPKRVSYSLVNIFKRTFSSEPPNSHSAEGDVVSLIKVLLPRMSEFVSWADSHASQFKHCRLYYPPDCQRY